MKELKAYRIDIFKNGAHETRYFDNEEDALASVKPTDNAFLLKRFGDTKYYDVIEQLNKGR